MTGNTLDYTACAWQHHLTFTLRGHLFTYSETLVIRTGRDWVKSSGYPTVRTTFLVDMTRGGGVKDQDVFFNIAIVFKLNCICIHYHVHV